MLGNPIIEPNSKDKSYTCNSGVLVNNLVYLDTNGVVQKASCSSLDTSRVLGIVKAKTNSTTAIVQFIGDRSGFAGIIPGKIYYLSTNGGVTLDEPEEPNIIVAVAIGKSSSTIELRLSSYLMFA